MTPEVIQRLAAYLGLASRPYGIVGMVLIVLYLVQAEVRFGARARSSRAGAADRRTSLILSLASTVPIFGFVLAMKVATPANATPVGLIAQFFAATLPGLPTIVWAAAMLGLAGLGVRLWAVLTLRHRYTRTLLVQADHVIERGGPYRFVRHPGYLGSLLCLNAIAISSGAPAVAAASLLATIPAYLYRIRVEDEMLIAAFGTSYADYRDEVGALLPFIG